MDFYRRHRRSILLGLLLLAMSLLYFISLGHLPRNASQEMMNHFFGADSWRVLESLKDSSLGSHYRDKVHPFFSLVAVSISRTGGLTGIEDFPFLVYRTVFGAGGCLLFWLYLYRTTSLEMAVAATALLFTTLALRVWSTLPETFLFGFFTLMLALNLIRGLAQPALVVLVAMAGTVTNAFLGIAYCALRLKNRRQISTVMHVVVFSAIALVLMQKNIYPSSDYFFNLLTMKEEARYVERSLSGIPFRIYDFFVSGFLIPMNSPVSEPVTSEYLWRVFVGEVASGTRRGLYVIAAVGLVLLLVTVAAVDHLRHPGIRERNVILAFLGFQLALHLVYGDAPFLYSLHFTPFLILFIASSSGIWARRIVPFALLVLALLIQGSNLDTTAALGLR